MKLKIESYENDVTSKANSIQLKTASGGSVCYICNTETEQVEWMSALEGAMQKILMRVAGGQRGGLLLAAGWVAEAAQEPCM